MVAVSLLSYNLGLYFYALTNMHMWRWSRHKALNVDCLPSVYSNTTIGHYYVKISMVVIANNSLFMYIGLVVLLF